MTNSSHIYVITTLEKLESDDKWFVNYGCSTVVGFYHDFTDAFEAVSYNGGDMHETVYDYALIEEMEPGLYPYGEKRWFFKYDKETDMYLAIDEPECVKHVCNFCFG